MKHRLYRSFLLVSSVFLCTFLLTGMGGTPKELENFATVEKINIADRRVLTKAEPVIVTFSSPMVEESAIGSSVAKEKMPFAIVPEVEGQGMWLSQTSFAFTTKNGFPRGRKYAILFDEKLKALDGASVRYFLSFRTQEVTVRSVTQGRYDEKKQELTLYVDFSMAVTEDGVKDHLTITDATTNDGIPLKMEGRPGENYRHTLTLSLGKYREKVKLAIRTDEEKDKNPLGLASRYTSTVRLPSPGAVTQSTASVNAEGGKGSPLFIRESYTDETYEGALVARFYLNVSLAAQDQKEFITVTPDLPYSINNSRMVLTFEEGVEPNTTITVTLKPGLTDASGQVLKEERSASRTTPNRRPAVRFAERGNYLTPIYGGRVGVNIVNVDKATVSLRRVYDNNMPFMALEPDYETYKLMRDMGFCEYVVNAKDNNILRRSIDIQELAKGQKGVFFLRVNGYTKTESDDNYYNSYASEQERLVVLTDVGITARVFTSGISVYAAALSTAAPLPNAQVRVYSESNQVVAEGVTNSEGVFVYKQPEEWDDQLRPHVVTVVAGKGDDADINFLPLEYRTGIDQQDSANRAYLDKGHEAFLYTPRGVFRPGETVDIKAFIRNADRQAPKPFPVSFSIINTRGLEIAKGSATLSEEGAANFAYKLPESAVTGKYSALLKMPGQQEWLGSVAFSVEDFVPPRLEVAVAPKQEVLVGSDTLPVDLSAKYLFGASGENLSYELGFKVTSRNFTHEDWKGYAFGDSERPSLSQVNLKYLTGTLDAKGNKEISFTAPDDWKTPAALHVLLIGNVEEDGGRWVTKTSSFTYFPTPYLLGMKTDERNYTSGQKASIEIAAVDPQGKPAESGELTAEVFLMQGNWHTVYVNGRYTQNWNERLIAQERKKLTLKNGKGTFDFTPAQHGHYLVRLEGEKNDVVATQRIGVWGKDGYRGNDGSGRLDAVELALDKASYRVGDVAKLSIKSPYAGTLFLGLERAGQLSTQTISMKTTETVVDIPVTEIMGPNIMITTWIIRPVEEKDKEWYPHRAHGIIPLLLDKAPYSLKVEAEIPTRVMPSAPLSIPLTITDEQGNPVEGEFSVALIDEGILSLTTFATPNPISYFMERRRFTGRSHDIYSALLRPEAKATPLLKAGGDAAADYQGSLSTQQVFLTAYVPVVRTGANGKAIVKFAIPEYSGKGRLMVVGASKNLFASMAAPVPVGRPVVVEATGPRAVAPGDTFELAINPFAMKGDEPMQGEAKISVKATGPVELSGTLQTSLPLGETDSTSAKGKALQVKAKALQESGIATVTISVEVAGKPELSFEKKMEIAVRPPFPRTSAVQTAFVEAGKEQTLTIPGKWLKGSVKATLSVDKSPVLSVLPALDYLREYPYGCLEQTVSRAWPYLTLTSVQNTLYPNTDSGSNNRQALSEIVARIATMQTSEGGFTMWPGYTRPDPWKSVHATYFLQEAKTQVSITPSVLNDSLGYMRFLLAAPTDYFGGEAYAYSTKAYAAFVLVRAGKAPLGWMQSLTEHEDKMWPSGRIFLAGAKALQAGNSKALQTLNDKMLDLSKVTLGYNESMESSLRNQSLLLYMWSLVEPTNKTTLRHCVSVAEKVGSQRWMTTQDAGMAALGLGTFLEKTKTSSDDFAGTLSLAGKLLQELQNGERVLLSEDKLPLDDDGSPKPVTIKLDDKAPAYCVYSVRGVPLEAPKPVSSNLAIQRVWRDSSNKVIDMSKGTVTLKKGDRIFVELSVRPGEDLDNLAVSDLLPGGLEVENPRLNTAAGATGGESGSYGLYMDLREDRLLVFYDRLTTNTRTYTYSMRAISRGTFVIPPLAAEGMYKPQVNAITPAGVVIVE